MIATDNLPSLYPVMLAGGHGSRLWPLSRQSFPKQFIKINNTDDSLLQLSLKRLEKLNIKNSPLLFCHHEYRFIAEQQTQNIKMAVQIYLEPEARNTAPALAIAALALQDINPNAIMLALPCDHHIGNMDVLEHALQQSYHAALEGYLVTFGLKPESPHTGYGYIRIGNHINNIGDDIYQISSFVEKPVQDKAQEFVNSGEYFWNSGMFCMKASQLLEELRHYQPTLLAAAEESYHKRYSDLSFTCFAKESFGKTPSLPIDKAIMEVTHKGAMVRCDNMDWSDIGSWSSLHELLDKDENGNSQRGNVIAMDSRNCHFYSKKQLIVGYGLDNIAVIAVADVVMVFSLKHAQDIKNIVEILGKQGYGAIVKQHPRMYRPWGWYETVEVGERFQVKNITVEPGGKLSLQRHIHRSEHWVVVSGAARVTRDEDHWILRENESVYLPAGCVHRLENPGKIPLTIIEVQSGAYLGEDDIERIDDIYRRSHIK